MIMRIFPKCIFSFCRRSSFSLRIDRDIACFRKFLEGCFFDGRRGQSCHKHRQLHTGHPCLPLHADSVPLPRRRKTLYSLCSFWDIQLNIPCTVGISTLLTKSLEQSYEICFVVNGRAISRSQTYHPSQLGPRRKDLQGDRH